MCFLFTSLVFRIIRDLVAAARLFVVKIPCILIIAGYVWHTLQYQQNCTVEKQHWWFYFCCCCCSSWFCWSPQLDYCGVGILCGRHFLSLLLLLRELYAPQLFYARLLLLFCCSCFCILCCYCFCIFCCFYIFCCCGCCFHLFCCCWCCCFYIFCCCFHLFCCCYIILIFFAFGCCFFNLFVAVFSAFNECIVFCNIYLLFIYTLSTHTCIHTYV